jgi:hypothetical protein
VQEATYGWVRSEGAGDQVGGAAGVRLMPKV